MRHERDRLLDILEAAQRIREDTNNLTAESFAAGRAVRQVVERNLEIIGEAAKHLSPAAISAMPGIDWRGLCGIRDVLIHGYFRSDPAILWHVINEECPAMIAAIQQRLSDASSASPPDG